MNRKPVFQYKRLPKGDIQLGLGFTKETYHTYNDDAVSEYIFFISLFKLNIYFGIGVDFKYDE